MSQVVSDAACVLLIRDGKVLAVSRKYDHTKFGLPGGKVDPGETDIQAALRELKEETGIDVSPRHVTLLYRGPANRGKIAATYLVIRDNGQEPIEKSDEGIVRWTDWDTVIAGPYGKYNQEIKNLYDMYCKLKEELERSDD
jgi:8-oxo-dGTP diphosphatase